MKVAGCRNDFRCIREGWRPSGPVLGCRPRIVNSEKCVDFQRLFRFELRRFKAEIGNFVTKRRSGHGFWPASCVCGCPGRQDAAERWPKCGTLDVCDASKIFTNIELHPPYLLYSLPLHPPSMFLGCRETVPVRGLPYAPCLTG